MKIVILPFDESELSDRNDESFTFVPINAFEYNIRFGILSLIDFMEKCWKEGQYRL